MVLLGWSLVLVSCAGGKSVTGTPATPGVAGTWEFLAVSSNSGGTTGIELALQEGTVLLDLLCWTSGRPDSDSVREPSSLKCRASGGSGGFSLDTAESKVENGRRFTGFLPHTSWFPGQYS
jgi:hypothetical protein